MDILKKRASNLTAGRRMVLLALAFGCAALAHAFAGEGRQMSHPTLALLSWLVGIGLAIASVYRPNEGNGEAATASVAWGGWEITGLLLLFVFAFLVRLIAIGSIPDMLSGDEASSGLAGVEIAEGRFNNPFILDWYGFPSLFLAIPAASIAIFGRTVEALRIPSALAGALTAVGLFWFARPLFGRGTAWLSAFLLSTLSFHIHLSRIGLNNIWDGLLGMGVIGLFWRGWQRRSRFLAAGVLVGLSQYFYTSGRLVPLIILVWLVGLSMNNFGQVKRRLGELGGMGLVAIVVYLPLALYSLNHRADFWAPVNRVSLLPYLIDAFQGGVLDGLIALGLNVIGTAMAFVSVSFQGTYSLGKPMLLEIPAIFFVLGVGYALFKLREPRFGMLLGWLASLIAIGAFSLFTAGHRFVLGAPVAVLLASIPLVGVAQRVVEAWPKSRTWAYGAVAIVAVVMGMADLRFYFLERQPSLGSKRDVNTEIAVTLAGYLQEHYSTGVQVIFFGAPKMWYNGFPQLPYLFPQAQAIDVEEKAPIADINALVSVGQQTVFVFLPHRQSEAALVEERYPGNGQWIFAKDGIQLFYVYVAGSP